jgi:nitrogen regulatory protein PII
MKAVLIVHNSAVDSEVTEALAKIGVDRYTKFTNTLGKGGSSPPHFNTQVWPGLNTATMVVLEPAKADQVMQKVRQMRQNLGSEGIKAFMWEIEEVT